MRQTKCYLLCLRWISDGSINSLKPDKRLNDLIDMNYAAYATFFDGLLTDDKKLIDIYRDACFFLNEIFKPIINEGRQLNSLQ